MGVGFSKLYQVTSQTQLSRPITLGHYTSWSTDSAGTNKVCDVTATAEDMMETLLRRHTFLLRPPLARWVGGGPTNRWPNERWSDNGMFPDVILCRYHKKSIKQNESQEIRFDDFLALAPEVEKTNPGRPDLMTFQHWLKKSTKPIPRCSIWWLSGVATRRRENQSQEARFDDFPALAPEVDKTSPRRLDLMIFWP